MSWRALSGVLFLLIFLAWQNVFATDIQCSLQTDSPKDQASDLWVASCASTCSAFLKAEPDSTKKDFAKNCKSFSDEVNSSFNASDVGKVFDLALTQCIPDAAKNVIVGPVKFILSLPQLVSYLLNSKGQENERWDQCSKSPDCRRAIARNTIRFQNMDTNQKYQLSDKQVDAQISGMSLSDLMNQAQHDHQVAQDDCLRQLGEIRRKISSDGEDWTPERHQQVFNILSNQAPHCPGVLQLVPPKISLPLQDHTFDQNDCLRKSANPIECLAYSDKLAVRAECLGFDKAKVEMCGNVMATVATLPIGGATTTLLPKLAEAAGETAVPVAELAAPEIETATATSTRIITKEAKPAAVVSAKSSVVVPQTTSVKNFIANYKSMIYASEEQNRRFMSIAEESTLAGQNKTRFFDVENSMMKKLNDSTNDKELVTSLTNFQKETMVGQVDALKAKYPQLQFEVYSDFKSVKIAIKGQEDLSPALSSQLQQDLNAAYQKSNAAFTNEVKKLGIKVPDAGDPSQWFKASYGKTLDETALTARFARQSQDVRMVSSDEVRGQMTQRLGEVEQSRQSLVQSQNMQPLLDSSGKATVPRQDVFDLVRKNDSPEKLSQAISSRYNIPFTPTDAAQLQAYAKGVDEFSPSILIAKRENPSLDGAVDGGTSADFLGMGSANLKATAEGIAGNRTNLNKALVGARSGEKQVTQTFKTRMAEFKKTVGGDVSCSGDDCVRVGALTDSQKTTIMRKLAQNPNTREVRMAFVGPGVSESARMQLASHGESIEKAFRKELEGHVPYDKLKEMTFGFDMQTTQLNQGSVNLVIGKSSATKLSLADQQEMQKAFAKALAKYNQDLRTYTQGTSRTSETAVSLKLVPGPGILGLAPDQNQN